MGLFGKKREDEEYEDDELEFDDDRKETPQEKRLKRELRDLKKENRKKRKEPPKPWGKKERLLVLILLGTTILISGILAVSSRGFGALDFSGFKFDLNAPDFNSLNIFREETIEIKKK